MLWQMMKSGDPSHYSVDDVSAHDHSTRHISDDVVYDDYHQLDCSSSDHNVDTNFMIAKQ